MFILESVLTRPVSVFQSRPSCPSMAPCTWRWWCPTWCTLRPRTYPCGSCRSGRSASSWPPHLVSRQIRCGWSWTAGGSSWRSTLVMYKPSSSPLDSGVESFLIFSLFFNVWGFTNLRWSFLLLLKLHVSLIYPPGPPTSHASSFVFIKLYTFFRLFLLLLICF